jgi:hypothetical protein
MKQKTVIFYVILAILLATSVFAEKAISFTGDIEVVNDKIFSDEAASVKLTIKNYNSLTSMFQVYPENPQWLLYTEPGTIEIDSEGSLVIDVLLDPTSSVQQSTNHGVPIIIKSLLTDEVLRIVQNVTIKSDRLRQYTPSIFLDVDVGSDGNVNPLDPVPVKLRVVNKNRLKYDEFTVFFASDLFEDSFTTNLDPSGDFSKQFSYEVDYKTLPQNLTLTVSMMGDGKSIGSPKIINFNIIPVYPAFQRNKSISKEFLMRSWEISFTNVGNVPKEEKVLIPMSGFMRLFSKATHEYEVVESNGVKNVAFTVSLKPGEATTLYVETNYRTFTFVSIFLLIIFIVGIIAYYILRSPVVITKRTTVLAKEEGGTSKLKILLNIRNRTNKPVEHIKVFEKLPHITEVEDDFEIGTVKPSKVLKSPRKGTLIRWDFSTLEPYEERIITYKIHSKLSILGEFKMAPTVLKYTSGKRVKKVEFKSMQKMR